VNDLEAAAGKAELTGQVRPFMTWLGEGRKLTQTGRIGLADARATPCCGSRISLRDVGDPPVWQQVLILAAYTLARVHWVIQAAIGGELPPARVPDLPGSARS